jgi:very-short-patch-repair endonuclease
MPNSIRWTQEGAAWVTRCLPEQLEYEKRGAVRTHRIADGDREIKPPPAPPKESKLEIRFDQQLRANELPAPERNYFFMDGRDLELDRAWPKLKVAVEIQGMAHRIKGKWKRDIEKRALAMLAGWRVLEVDGAAIKDGRAIAWTKRLLGVAT